MKTMLIAVASEIITEALSQTFWNEYDVHTCSQGDRALHLLSQINPDILILGLSLPGMTGISVLQEADYTPPVILALSYLTSEDVVQAAQTAGVGALLRLPCSVSHIRSRLSQLLKLP